MKRIGIIVFIMLASLLPSFAQREDLLDAIMHIKEEQYYQARQSIENCVNHPKFYEMSLENQSKAWFIRAASYQIIMQSNDESFKVDGHDALDVVYESLMHCIENQSFYDENSTIITSLLYDVMAYYYNQGREDLDAEKVSDAIPKLERVYEISKMLGGNHSMDFLYLTAIAYYQAEDYSTAKAYFSEVLRNYDIPDARIYIARCDDRIRNSSNYTNNQPNLYSSIDDDQTMTVQNPQWDVFNSISTVKRIDLVFDADDRVLLASSPNSINHEVTRFWKANEYGNANVYFTIYGDYSVSMSYRTKMYSERDDNKGRGCGVELAINGTGVLAWESERMVIRLNVTETVSGGEYDFYNYSANTTECHIYDSDSHSSTYTYEVVMSSINSNQILLKGNDITSSIRGVKCFAGGEYRQNWYFHTKIKLANRPIRINVEHKSQSEMNAQNSDMYGKWQWNNDRSVIYLESTTKDAHLVLWNNDGNLSWGFQLFNTATGYKTETADSGQDLAYLMLSFDGASEQSFSFVKTENNFVYAQYDRFLGTLKHDASILNQIKDKRIMILNYKQNGSTKTAMFQLEGLEAIYNAITQ